MYTEQLIGSVDSAILFYNNITILKCATYWNSNTSY